uniref:Uncharacterized protein n=1 Tax=Rhizophora mucronata TaxID=61149 RepID=A0A2P2QL72_RHIMU
MAKGPLVKPSVVSGCDTTSVCLPC